MRTVHGARQGALLARQDVRLEVAGGALAVHTPYDTAFVAALKALLPASDRKWEPTKKAWLVAPHQGQAVADLMGRHFAAHVAVPEMAHGPAAAVMQLLDVRYIGAAKLREDGGESAFGWANGGWTVIFPRAVLMAWFGQTQRPGEAATLYGVLGVGQDAAPDEIKRAWKRLARQWHPDVAREPDAASQFRTIQEAYEVLGDAAKRARYNAGLQLAALARQQEAQQDAPYQADGREYHAPLRCGWLLVEGEDRLGRTLVRKILQWQDIVNGAGEVLVTTWPMGAVSFQEQWVRP